jgi:hypothetical protein
MTKTVTAAVRISSTKGPARTHRPSRGRPCPGHRGATGSGRGLATGHRGGPQRTRHPHRRRVRALASCAGGAIVEAAGGLSLCRSHLIASPFARSKPASKRAKRVPPTKWPSLPHHRRATGSGRGLAEGHCCGTQQAGRTHTNGSRSMASGAGRTALEAAGRVVGGIPPRHRG